MNRIRCIMLTGLAGLLLMTAGWTEVRAAEPTAVVRQGSMKREIRLTGEVDAAEAVHLQSPTTRQWNLTLTYLVPDGSLVRAGETVATFDTTQLGLERLDLEKQCEEARIRIAQTEAAWETRRQDLLLQQAQAEKELNVALLFAELPADLIPQSDYQDYQLRLEQARLGMEKVAERLANLERTRDNELGVVLLEYEQAKISLNRILREIESMTVRAPISGLVVVETSWSQNRKYQVGDNIHRGQPLARIPNLETLRVKAHAHDPDVPFLRPGLAARVSLDAFPGTVYRGHLTEIGKMSVSQRYSDRLKVFPLFVEFDDTLPDFIKPGMTAQVNLATDERVGLIIDRQAVHTDPGGRTVLRPLTEGEPPVSIEILDASDAEILFTANVRPGDEFRRVTDGRSDGRTDDDIDWIDVKKQRLEFSVPGTGTLRADKAVDIGPPSVSQIYQFKIMRMVAEGQDVQAGDFLLQFDPSELTKRLRDEEADLEKVQRERQKTEAARDLAVRDLELELEEARAQREKAEGKLTGIREFAASLKIREAEYEAQFDRLKVAMLEKKLTYARESARLELKLLQDKETFHQERVRNFTASIAAFEIRSPIDGVVIYQTDWNNRKKQVGSEVYMMETVLAIPDLRSLVVKGFVGEVDASKVRVGQPVAVTFDALPEKIYHGSVAEIADMFTPSAANPKLKVLEIQVALDELDLERMRPGMSARLQFQAELFQDVITLPLAVIQTRGDMSYVWVEEEGRPVVREVAVGKNNGLVAVIESGLNEGERVAGRPVE
ncbi:MAG: HlyD family efflux transporter periplasmic adaptor subunit [Acidobacteria bacterium]|nr:HlyD family efflux transporter periplasmic adaptor subunit [Acidobacteriota bacterium]